MEFFSKEIEETAKEFGTDLENGLSQDSLTKSKDKYGFNELQGKKKQSLFVKFLNQFKDFMIVVLIIAAIVSGFIGIKEGEGITDSLIILVVVIVNAIIGVVQESKAEKSLEALQKLSAHVCKVQRDGKLQVVPAKEIFPGDLVILETGDFVPADLRLVEAVNLKIQEAALTRWVSSYSEKYCCDFRWENRTWG